MEETCHNNQDFLKENIKKLMVEKQTVFYKQIDDINPNDVDNFDGSCTI